MTDPVNENPQNAAQPGDVVAQGEQVPAPEGAPGSTVAGGTGRETRTGNRSSPRSRGRAASVRSSTP